MTAKDEETESLIEESGHLNYLSSLSSEVVKFNPKYLAKDGLTMMIKVMAQLKNLRRGHTAQGIVKKVEIDSSNEGYANFMAPDRMRMIERDAAMAAAELKKFQDSEENGTEPAQSMPAEAKEAQRKLLQQRVLDAQKVYSPEILRPQADTFLTAEWDEMVPFPTSKSISLYNYLPVHPPFLSSTLFPLCNPFHSTFPCPTLTDPSSPLLPPAAWKLRFEGYGPSTYNNSNHPTPPFPLLLPAPLPDSFPPFYQPQGPSHYGSIFADPPFRQVDGGTMDKETMPANLTEGGAKGCGVPVPVRHSALEGGGGGGGGW